MRYIQDTIWEQVFAGWRDREATNPGWIEVATKIKGWPDWESWRRFSASLFKAETLDWQIFTFDNPMEEIPTMLVGPYTGWQSRHPAANNFTFSEMLDLPEQYNFWGNNSTIIRLISDFPAPTEFIGLVREDNQKIVCIEGHHRATAVAVAKKQGAPINFKINPTIALATLPLAELNSLDIMRKRGSTKDMPK